MLYYTLYVSSLVGILEQFKTGVNDRIMEIEVFKKQFDESFGKLTSKQIVKQLQAMGVKFIRHSYASTPKYKVEDHIATFVTKADLVATVEFFTTKEGGRITPVSSGYISNMRLSDSNESCYATQYFNRNKSVSPGETVVAHIVLGTKKKLVVGQEFAFSEGRRKIGKGIILEILNKDLRK